MDAFVDKAYEIWENEKETTTAVRASDSECVDIFMKVEKVIDEDMANELDKALTDTAYEYERYGFEAGFKMACKMCEGIKHIVSN